MVVKVLNSGGHRIAAEVLHGELRHRLPRATSRVTISYHVANAQTGTIVVTDTSGRGGRRRTSCGSPFASRPRFPALAPRDRSGDGRLDQLVARVDPPHRPADILQEREADAPLAGLLVVRHRVDDRSRAGRFGRRRAAPGAAEQRRAPPPRRRRPARCTGPRARARRAGRSRRPRRARTPCSRSPPRSRGRRSAPG